MRDTNESTNSRVLYFSIFSMCYVAAAAVAVAALCSTTNYRSQKNREKVEAHQRTVKSAQFCALTTCLAV